MTYITRDDGEQFVIPSYRDVLGIKKQALLKREILLLSSNYGEYVALQRKGTQQYEVAFSSDPGYLLGETVWHFFKRPFDLIYCEVLPGSDEAILVIVKAGMVYLDGVFPVSSVVNELVIFNTQQNNFHIYIYGDVPISQHQEVDKFSFDPSSVRSFTVLEEPIFHDLPLLRAFQLKPVNAVLREKGIGVLPVKSALIGLAILGALWMIWNYFATHKKEIPTVIVRAVNPYQIYLDMLSTPAPTNEIHWVTQQIWRLNTMPGWVSETVEYSESAVRIGVKSLGASTQELYAWARKNNAIIEIANSGFFLTFRTQMQRRAPPRIITNVNTIIGSLIDRMHYILPGDSLDVGAIIDRTRFIERPLTIKFTNITPSVLDLIGQQLQGLPVILNKIVLTDSNGNLSGTITLQVLGS